MPQAGDWTNEVDSACPHSQREARRQGAEASVWHGCLPLHGRSCSKAKHRHAALRIHASPKFALLPPILETQLAQRLRNCMHMLTA